MHSRFDRSDIPASSNRRQAHHITPRNNTLLVKPIELASAGDSGISKDKFLTSGSHDTLNPLCFKTKFFPAPDPNPEFEFVVEPHQRIRKSNNQKQTRQPFDNLWQPFHATDFYNQNSRSHPVLSTNYHRTGREKCPDTVFLSSINSSFSNLQKFYEQVESEGRKDKRDITARSLLNLSQGEDFNYIQDRRKFLTNQRSETKLDVNQNQVSFSLLPPLPPHLRRRVNKQGLVDRSTTEVSNTVGDQEESNWTSLNALEESINSNTFIHPRELGSNLRRSESNAEIQSQILLWSKSNPRFGVSNPLKQKLNRFASTSSIIDTNMQGSRYLTDLEWRVCHAVNIYIYRNGVDNQSPMLVHVPPARKANMRTVLQVLNDRVKYPVGYAKALYKMDGTRIRHPCELEMYNNYVVASNQDKHFKMVQYGRRRSPLLVLSPVSKHTRAIRENNEQLRCSLIKKGSSEDTLGYVCPKVSLEEITRCCNPAGNKTVRKRTPEKCPMVSKLPIKSGLPTCSDQSGGKNNSDIETSSSRISTQTTTRITTSSKVNFKIGTVNTVMPLAIPNNTPIKLVTEMQNYNQEVMNNDVNENNLVDAILAFQKKEKQLEAINLNSEVTDSACSRLQYSRSSTAGASSQINHLEIQVPRKSSPAISVDSMIHSEKYSDFSDFDEGEDETESCYLDSGDDLRDEQYDGIEADSSDGHSSLPVTAEEKIQFKDEKLSEDIEYDLLPSDTIITPRGRTYTIYYHSNPPSETTIGMLGKVDSKNNHFDIENVNSNSTLHSYGSDSRITTDFEFINSKSDEKDCIYRIDQELNYVQPKIDQVKSSTPTYQTQKSLVEELSTPTYQTQRSLVEELSTPTYQTQRSLVEELSLFTQPLVFIPEPPPRDQNFPNIFSDQRSSHLLIPTLSQGFLLKDIAPYDHNPSCLRGYQPGNKISPPLEFSEKKILSSNIFDTSTGTYEYQRSLLQSRGFQIREFESDDSDSISLPPLHQLSQRKFEEFNNNNLILRPVGSKTKDIAVQTQPSDFVYRNVVGENVAKNSSTFIVQQTFDDTNDVFLSPPKLSFKQPIRRDLVPSSSAMFLVEDNNNFELIPSPRSAGPIQSNESGYTSNLNLFIPPPTPFADIQQPYIKTSTTFIPSRPIYRTQAPRPTPLVSVVSSKATPSVQTPTFSYHIEDFIFKHGKKSPLRETTGKPIITRKPTSNIRTRR